MPINWTDAENDTIVASYFAMLAEDVAARPYRKSEYNQLLQSNTGRSRKSIEFKLQNISAVLKGLGEDWIPGYRPAFHFQKSLTDAVVRWLDGHQDWLFSTSRSNQQQVSRAFEEEPIMWIGPPPTQSNLPPPKEAEEMLEIATRFDVAQRDARNRALGRAGEERVLAHERGSLSAAGRADLATLVDWVSDTQGDGLGYDIRSFDSDGGSRLIEVKTTNGWERTPFYVTQNELDVAERYYDEWRIIRLWNFARGPKAFELRPPLSAHVVLTATSFRADWPERRATSVRDCA